MEHNTRNRIKQWITEAIVDFFEPVMLLSRAIWVLIIRR